MRLAGSLIASGLLASCGIRLPISPLPTERREVSINHALPQEAPARDPDVLVWLVSDSYHTGMVFPFDWLQESGFIPPKNFGNPKFVTMSWGNVDAYSAAGFDHPWKVFRVLLTPTPSVMELIPANWHIAEVLPSQRIWRRLTPRDRGPALAHFLNECSATDADGIPRVVCPSSWGNGVQLESRHSYFIPRICNIWTAQAMESLGCDINPWLAITANGLIREAEKPRNGFEQIWPGGGKPPPR